MGKKNLGFRGWFYFRYGWSGYFAFIFAAVNTLTVTYFLAIERYPFLQEIFPTFVHYIIIICSIGIPVLVLVGYVHWKKSGARKAEVDIYYEVNPYLRRTLVNTEMVLMLNLKLSELILKSSNGKQISQEEIEEVKKLQEEFTDLTKQKSLRKNINLNFLKNRDDIENKE